jgi:hypothetical protein
LRIEEGFHFSTSFTPSAPSAAARVCATRLGRLGKLFIDFFFVSEQLLDARALLHGEEINGPNFTSRLSCFLFRSSRTALLNSTPQLLARDCRAVAQGAQPGPGELPMDAAA